MFQARAWQQTILTAAKSTGYTALFWVVIVRWPYSRAVGTTPQERELDRYCKPTIGGKVPVILVGQDPPQSRQRANLLAQRISQRERYDQSYRIGINLTDRAILNYYPYFIWDDIEIPCPYCGQPIATQKCNCHLDDWGVKLKNIPPSSSV